MAKGMKMHHIKTKCLCLSLKTPLNRARFRCAAVLAKDVRIRIAGRKKSLF